MIRNKLSPTEIESLASNIKIVNTKVTRQLSALTKDVVSKVFGIGQVAGRTYEASSPEAYLAATQALQHEYLSEVMRSLSDPKQAKLIGGGRFSGLTKSELREQINLLGQQENLDLSLLSSSMQNKILDRYRSSSLKLQDVIKEGGFPSISLPTENEYRSFLKYFVDPTAGLRQGERNSSTFIEYNEN
jgi:hypothetical protein